MEPPVTNCPANSLTPSICGFESRPFLELPTPFLWAMRRSDLDLGDANRGRRLPVAAMAPVVLPAFEFHDPDLPAAPLGDDLAGDPGARERLRVRDDFPVARHEEHGPELDGRALVAGQLLDRDDLSRRHAVLLAAGGDNRFHEPRPSSIVTSDEHLSDHTTTPRVNWTGAARPTRRHRGPLRLCTLHVLGEAFAHEQARAVHPRLHRRQADAERRGDVRIRQ